MATGDIGSLIDTAVTGCEDVVLISDGIAASVGASSITTWTVSSDGTLGETPLATLGLTYTYDYPKILHIYGDIYVVYGYLEKFETVSISSDGLTLSTVAHVSSLFGALRWGKLRHVSGTVYAVPVSSNDPSVGTYIATVSISNDGTSILFISKSIIQSAVNINTIAASMVEIDANYFAVSISDSHGFSIVTVSISNAGSVSVVDSEVVSASADYSFPVSCAKVIDGMFLFPYLDNSLGCAVTKSINSAGVIGSTLDTISTLSNYPIWDICQVGNSLAFLLTYYAPSESCASPVSVSVDSAGNISVIDTASFSLQGIQPIHHAGGNIYLWGHYTGADERLGTIEVETPTVHNLILELAFGQSIFTVSPTWTDVTSELKRLKTKRGRQHQLGKVEAGEATFTLLNQSGNWWRNNTAGAYYGTSGDVKPLTLIRLRRYYSDIEYPIWFGVTESFNPTWLQRRGGYIPLMEIGCVDMFKTLARYKIEALTQTVGSHEGAAKITSATISQNYVYIDNSYSDINRVWPGQMLLIGDDDSAELNYINGIDYTLGRILMINALTKTYSTSKNAYIRKFPEWYSGTRINDVLYEAAGKAGNSTWVTTWTDIDAGQIKIIEHIPPIGGTNALSHIQQVTESEGGNFFIARDGKVIFQDSLARHTDTLLKSSQAVFSNKG